MKRQTLAYDFAAIIAFLRIHIVVRDGQVNVIEQIECFWFHVYFLGKK